MDSGHLHHTVLNSSRQKRMLVIRDSVQHPHLYRHFDCFATLPSATVVGLGRVPHNKHRSRQPHEDGALRLFISLWTNPYEVRPQFLPGSHRRCVPSIVAWRVPRQEPDLSLIERRQITTA